MWTQHDTVKIYLPDNHPNKSVGLACFDFDKTLTTSKSGRKFLKDENDIILTYESVITTLLSLIEKGYTIVIISNQLKFNDNIFKIFDRFKDTLRQNSIDPYILISTSNDAYRKPENNMFRLLLNLLEMDHDMVKDYSFYCGDAADINHNNPMYRWSDSDAKFAQNSGIKFYTPDQIFEESKLPLLQNQSPEKTDVKTFTEVKQMIINVGNQGSGKSTFSKNMDGFVVVSQDVYKTRCEKVVEQNLGLGKSVIVDNTNPSRATRSKWISLAKKYGYEVMIFWFARDGRPFNQLREKPVPEIAYSKYSSQFEEPNHEEGAKVFRIN